MSRRRELYRDEDYQECTECRKPKRRFKDFSPRYGHCPKHTKYDPACRACGVKQNNPRRQPRCKACDRARGARKRCFDQLARLVTDFPEGTLEPKDSSYKTVTVHGVNDLPKLVLANLKKLAKDRIDLNWDTAPISATSPAAGLFSIPPLEVVQSIPKGARTYAPFYDIAAAAGAFGEATLPQRTGFLTREGTCCRTTSS